MKTRSSFNDCQADKKSGQVLRFKKKTKHKSLSSSFRRMLQCYIVAKLQKCLVDYKTSLDFPLAFGRRHFHFWMILILYLFCCLIWAECSKNGMDPTSVRVSFVVPLSHFLFFALQSQEMLSNLESASVRIVKPHQPPSFSAGRTAPSSLPHQPQQQQSQVGSTSAASSATSSSTQAPGPSCGLTPDSAGGLRMATIQEDTSIDSHLGEEGLSDDFTTAGACSSGMKSSYEDLTEQNQPAKERRRLKRQECIDTKETECWEPTTSTDICFREHYIHSSYRK